MGNLNPKLCDNKVKDEKFRQACLDYMRIVRYANENLQDKNNLLRNLVYDYFYTDENKIKLNPDLEFVQMVHKLHPIKYKNKQGGMRWLYSACKRQLVFCKKIDPLLYGYRFIAWKKMYIKFLSECKYHPEDIIPPNLKEDFMWHSHMQLPSYLKDMTKLVGFQLDHDDEIPEELLEKFRRKRYYLKHRINFEQKEDGSCVAVKKDYRGKFTTNDGGGGSSCGGSGCGGGGCGGCG